jgi:hypothetical protein
MICIPIEIVYEIISYSPINKYNTVCKTWNIEINRIRRNAYIKISNWYKKRVCPKFVNISNFITVKNMLRSMIIHYPPNKFISYPEKIVRILNINLDMLDILPLIYIRKRSDVCLFILNLPLELSDYMFVENTQEYIFVENILEVW